MTPAIEELERGRADLLEQDELDHGDGGGDGGSAPPPLPPPLPRTGGGGGGGGVPRWKMILVGIFGILLSAAAGAFIGHLTRIFTEGLEARARR